MERVIITRPFIGICNMQVCAIKDATNEEILAVCNKENPAGTTNGWREVVRTEDPDSLFSTRESLPVRCEDNPERLHLIVLC